MHTGTAAAIIIVPRSWTGTTMPSGSSLRLPIAVLGGASSHATSRMMMHSAQRTP
jgi:hypothetical protein